jgi:TPR repeat protein
MAVAIALTTLAALFLSSGPLEAQRQAAPPPAAQPPSPELVADMEARAADGDMEAVFGLAVLNFFGEGVPQDRAKALELLEKAAAKDHVMALGFLGQIYEHGEGVEKNVRKAVRYYERASDLGDVMAGLALGGIYFYGADGVKAQPKKAFRLFSDAAEKGQHQAQLMLGLMYEQGAGVSKDPAKSWQYYLAAANNKDDRGEAALAVGDLYVSGRNPTVPQDLDKGREYYRIAASYNVPEAKERLALLDRAKAEAAADAAKRK